MYSPFTTTFYSFDPNEIQRQKSGRPATREEILDRHLRDNRDIAASLSTNAQPISSPSKTGRPDHINRDSSQPFSRVRRTLSRVLMTAAERIEPEAA